MRGFASLALLATLLGGGWYFFENYRLEGLDEIRLAPKGESSDKSTTSARLAGRAVSRGLRVLTFDGRALDADSFQSSFAVKLLANCDLACIHGVRTPRDDAMFELLEAVAAAGAARRHYIGPRVGRGSDYLQYVFVYDPATLEIDENATYTIDDRDDALAYDPLVGGFRARGPAPESALTFSVLLWRTRDDLADQEAALLGPLIRAVRNDGRGEDDLLVAGRLGVDRETARRLYLPIGFREADPDAASLESSGLSSDYLLFDPLATREFAGAAGVLRLGEGAAEAAADWPAAAPAWMELRTQEGAASGAVAAQRDDPLHF